MLRKSSILSVIEVWYGKKKRESFKVVRGFQMQNGCFICNQAKYFPIFPLNLRLFFASLRAAHKNCLVDCRQ